MSITVGLLEVVPRTGQSRLTLGRPALTPGAGGDAGSGLWAGSQDHAQVGALRSGIGTGWPKCCQRWGRANSPWRWSYVRTRGRH